MIHLVNGDVFFKSGTFSFKVVIRRLPPSLTKEQLEEHLQPLPEHDYFELFANDSRLAGLFGLRLCCM